LEFFSAFFVHTSLQERGFLLEKRGFDTFEVINHEILDLLGHGIQILITRSISPSNTLNFFQNFSFVPFSRNDSHISKNATWARENATKKRNFRPVNAPIATCNDSIDKSE